MALNITTPLADQWEKVPEQYKQLVREGKMSHAQALKYAVKEKAPTEEPKAVSAPRKSLDPEMGNMEARLRTGVQRAGQSVDAVHAGVVAGVDEQAALAKRNRKLSLLETLESNYKAEGKDEGFLDKINPISYAMKAVDAATKTAAQKYISTTKDDAEIDTARAGLETVKNEQLSQIQAAQKVIGSLPQDAYTPEVVDALNRGDFITAVKNVPGMIMNQTIEAVPELATQLGIVVGTAALTRNPMATAAAARVAGGAGGYSELGSDVNEVYSKLSEEDKKDPEKVRAALETAFDASTARAAIEGLIPGAGKLVTAGKPLGKAVAGNLASQFVGDAGGEAVASTIKGNTASFGEIVAEGLGGVAGTATESGVELYQQQKQNKTLLAEFDKKQAELDTKLVDNKVATEQTKELEKQVDNISSGNKPVIQDLFSGESVPAEVVAAQQAAIESGLVPAPEKQTETFNAEVDLAKKVEANKNKEVEGLVQEELTKQKEVKDAEEVLSNKYDLVGAPSIEKEARQRLAVEQQAIADRPFNRTPEGLAQLPKVLANHKATRMFQLKEEVAKERLAQVEKAQKVVDAVKEQEVRTKIEQQVAKEKAKAPEQATLSMKYPQQPKTKERGYTGSMTDTQKVDEAKDMAFKKELATLPPEQAQVLLEETTKAQKAEVARVKAEEKQTATAYTTTKNAARAAIVEDVRRAMPDALPADRSVEIGRRMVKWNEANPKETFVPTATTKPKATTLTEKIAAKERSKDKKAATVQAGREQKKAEQVYQGFKKEALDSGLPEKEARVQALAKLEKHLEDTDSKEALPKEAESTLRDQLRSKAKPSDKSAPSALIAASNAKVEETFPIYHDTVDEGLNSGKQGLEDTLAYMAAATDTPEDYRKLAARLLPIVKKLNLNYERMPESAADKNWGGFYDPITNTIHIGEYSHETLLHETLHGVLWHILNGSGPFKNNMSAKMLVKQLEDIRKHMIQYIKNNPKEFTQQELKYIMKHALSNQGQLTDIHELLSYTMTKGIGQRIALKIPSTNKVKAIIDNVMDAFARAVGRMFGMESKVEQTALKDIITLAGKALDIAESRPDLMDEAATAIKDKWGAAPSTLIDEEQVTTEGLKRTSIAVPIPFTNREVVLANMDTRNNVMGKLKDVLTAGYGNSKNILESLERSQGLIGEYLQRAKARFDTKERALHETAAKRGLTFASVAEEFNSAVTNLEKLDDQTAITQAKEALVRNYGDAAGAYFANRREIDALTDIIIDTRMDDPRPLTAKEAAIYSKMRQELGKYYTRAYASNLQGVDSVYRATVLKAYEAWRKGKATIEQTALAKIMQDAIDVIKATYVLIPDETVLADYELDQLENLAAGWGIDVDTLDATNLDEKKEAYIQALSDFREAHGHPDGPAAANRAEQLARELLEDSEKSPLLTYLRGAKQDRTVVEARSKIPEELRKFLGEYSDVSLKAMTTILKQATFAFNTRALGEIRASEMAKGDMSKVLTVQEFAERGIDPADWTLVKGEAFGPLDGMYIENSLVKKLKDVQVATASFSELLSQPGSEGVTEAALSVAREVSKGWIKAAGVIKLGQLIINPLNAVFNYMGGGLTLLSTGALYNPSAIWRAHATASKLIAAQSVSVVDPDVSLIIRNNQIDSSYLGSLRATEMDKVKMVLMARMGDKGAIARQKAWAKTKEYARGGKEVYAMADVVWKIASFYDRLELEQKVNKAQGSPLTDEQVERDATKKNTISTFSYSRVPNIAKLIEKGGVTYILPYTYEAFRAPMGSFLVGISDITRAASIKDPKAKAALTAHGALQSMGSLAVLAGVSTMAHALMVALGGEDEEKDQKEIAKLREFVPEYSKYADYFKAGVDSEGHAVLFDFSRIDPNGPASEFARMYAGGAEPEEYIEYIKKLPISNKYGASILGAIMSMGDKGAAAQNTKVERWWPEAYETLSDNLGPNTVKAIDKILPSWPSRALDPDNPQFDFTSTVIKYLGGSQTKVNLQKAVEFSVRDYDRQKEEAQDSIKNLVRTETELTPEEYAKAFWDATEIEKKAYDNLAGKYQAAINLGYSPEQAKGSLLAAKLSKKDANEIVKGTYSVDNSLLLSKSSLERLRADIVGSTENKELKAKRARNFDAALKAIEKYNLPVSK